MACNNGDDPYHEERASNAFHYRTLGTRTSQRNRSQKLNNSKLSKGDISTEMPQQDNRRKTVTRHRRRTRCKANTNMAFPMANGKSPSLPATEYRLRGKLRWLFELDTKFAEYFPWAFVQTGFTETNEKGRQWQQLTDQLYYEGSGSNGHQRGTHKKLEGQGRHFCITKEDNEIESDPGYNNLSQELGNEAPSVSTYQGPRVTRASSKCSTSSGLSDARLMGMHEVEDENWRFQAEVLLAECNLQRIEKELATRRWKKDCAERDRAIRMAQALRSAIQYLQEKHKNLDRIFETGSLQDSAQIKPGNLDTEFVKVADKSKRSDRAIDANDKRIQKLQSILGRYSQSNSEPQSPRDFCQNVLRVPHRRLEKFQEDSHRLEVEFDAHNECARDIVKRLKELQRISGRQYESSKFPEDHAETSEWKQEDLPPIAPASAWDCEAQELEVSREKPADSATTKNESNLASEAVGRARSLFCNNPDERRCIFETAVLRKQLDFLSSELTETEEIASLIRAEYRSLLSGNRRRRQASQRDSQIVQASEKELVGEEVLCRAAIRSIAAQVQAETEQWSRMQDILHHLKNEMEEVHQERDLWEERALHAEAQLASFQEDVHEWRVRAQAAEEQIATLQSEVNKLRNKVERVRYRHALEQSRWLDAGSQLKYDLASSSSDGQALPQHEQIVEDAVESNGYKDGDDDEPCESLKDGNRNTTILDYLRTSEFNTASFYKLRQKYHTPSVGSETELCEQQEHFTSSEQESSIQSTSIGTDMKENRVTQKNSKTADGQFQFESLNQEEQGRCILKSWKSCSAQRPLLGEIQNLGSSSSLRHRTLKF